MGLLGAFSSRKAAKRQKKLSQAYMRELQTYQNQFGDLNADFTQQFKDLSSNFNPYDLQAEFDSLYEAVIVPMERQFSETTLPQIRQSYSGGGYGSAMFSGARESAEANARQQLSMNEALLRYQARGEGIERNFQDYDRRRQDLGLQYEMGKEPIKLGLDIADKRYGAKSDAIAARAAADSAWGDVISGAVQGAVQGGMAGGPWGAVAGGAAGALGGSGSTAGMNNMFSMFNQGGGSGSLMGFTGSTSGPIQTYDFRKVNPNLYN